MRKTVLIILLASSLVASWIWPRFGWETSPSQQAPVVNVPDPREDPEPSEAPPSLTIALGAIMDAMQAAPGFEGASLGLCVLGDHTDPVYAYRAEESMTPASTLKAVTSATALEMLGPDFRFETKLAATKPFVPNDEGTFTGDLIIVGGGDPTFAKPTLSLWAAQLKKKGLRKLSGRVLADARHFPDALIPNAWDWGDVSNYYGAAPSGLNLDYNRFEVTWKPAETVGEPAVLHAMQPPLPWLERDLRCMTGPAESQSWTSIYGGPYANTLTFRGSIPLGSTSINAQGAIPDPAHHAAHALQEQLTLLDIAVTDEPSTSRRLTSMPEAKEVLFAHRSEPLPKIIRYLHRTSDNMVTECLFLSLTNQDPLQRSGQEIVTMHWAKRGVPLHGLRMEDGSGLARADYIRPLDLAQVLWAARRGPHGDTYFGTLNRYHNGRVRWKGGAMSRVRAYTGYSDNGYTFALMINNYLTDASTLADWRTRLVNAILEAPHPEDE